MGWFNHQLDIVKSFPEQLIGLNLGDEFLPFFSNSMQVLKSGSAKWKNLSPLEKTSSLEFQRVNQPSFRFLVCFFVSDDESVVTKKIGNERPAAKG